MNQEEMDSTLLKLAVQDYRKFITECKLVEKEVLPTYAKEIVFRNLELKTAFDKKQVAHALFEYAIPRDAHDFSAQVERIHEQPSLQLTPFAEINWSIDLELLPIIDDNTMSYNYRIPLENAESLKGAVGLPSVALSDAPGTSASSTGGESRSGRLRALRDGIVSRVAGKRQKDTKRSLADTLNKDASNPTCVLLAVIKWSGPAATGLSVSGLTLNVGSYEMTMREPAEMHYVGHNCIVLDSSNVHSWSNSHGQQGYASHNVPGVHPRSEWLNHHIHSTSSAHMSLILKQTDYSIPGIGFAFSQFAPSADGESRYRATLEGLRVNHQPGTVKLRGHGEECYWVSRDLLTSSSGYFRAFLTEAWSHDCDQLLLFPQMAPFTTCPEVIPMVVYYVVRRTIPPGMSENAAELIQAADALDMPDLQELAQIALIGTLTKENVTQIITFAWELQSHLLLRASLIFLRVNYDELYVKDKDDLAQLSRLLSSPRFMSAFTLAQNASLSA